MIPTGVELNHRYYSHPGGLVYPSRGCQGCPGAPDCGSGTGAGGCPAAVSRGDGDTPRFWAGSRTPKASSDVRPSSVDWCCCAILASRCEFTAAGLIAATVKPNPFGSSEASVGGELAGSSAESISAGVAPSPTESGDDDFSSTSMSPLGSLLLASSPPNVVW